MSADVAVTYAVHWGDDGSLRLVDACLDDVSMTLLKPHLDAFAESQETHEVEVLDSRGATRVISLALAAMHDASGVLPAQLLVVTDVTEQQVKMQQAVARFGGTMAHDLGNPLNAIEGWAEVLREQLDNDELSPAATVEQLGRITAASARMRELIGDLVAHASSSVGALNREEVDPHAMVLQIAHTFGVAERVRCVDLPLVFADPLLLRQLLENLVGNALKYVAPGSLPEVEVVGQVVGDLVTLRVSDRGVGLPPDAETLIFDEFYRGHRDFPGSGLGLSICRDIVHRHGGTIRAFAREGGGTTFEVTLPQGS